MVNDLPHTDRSEEMAPAPPGRRHYPHLITHEVADGLSDRFMAEMDVTLSKIPGWVMEAVSNAGYRFLFGPTLLALRPDLQRQRPRGYAPGKTFEHVKGLHDWRRKQFCVFEYYKVDLLATRYSRNEQAAATLRHELGHAFDGIIGSVSASEWFCAAYEQDIAAIAVDSTIEQYQYYLQSGEAGRRETFAEIFADVLGGGPDTEVTMKAVFGTTYWAMKDFLRRKP